MRVNNKIKQRLTSRKAIRYETYRFDRAREEIHMAEVRRSEALNMQARGAAGSSPPTRNETSDVQSSVIRNPAPDASPPSVPSTSRTFTVGN
jgi:hypothetical protein